MMMTPKGDFASTDVTSAYDDDIKWNLASRDLTSAYDDDDTKAIRLFRNVTSAYDDDTKGLALIEM